MSVIVLFAELWFAAVCRAENVELVRRDSQKAVALGGTEKLTGCAAWWRFVAALLLMRVQL